MQRTLDDLDDEDALVIGRFFSRVGTATVMSVIGMSVSIGVAVAVLGLGPIGIGVLGAFMGGGVAVSARHRTRTTLGLDLGLSAEASRLLLMATGNPHLARWRAPKSDDDIRAWGHRIIDHAKTLKSRRG